MIFSNLLTPAGAALRSANFTLRVYKAEDLPQSEFCSNEIQRYLNKMTSLSLLLTNSKYSLCKFDAFNHHFLFEIKRVSHFDSK